MRLTSEFVVSALIRRAEADGAYAAVVHRGDPMAGAIFVLVDGLEGTVALYGPAPPTMDDDAMPADAALTGNRLFAAVPLDPLPNREAADAAMERERRFDDDLWLVEITDRKQRSFLPVIDS